MARTLKVRKEISYKEGGDGVSVQGTEYLPGLQPVVPGLRGSLCLFTSLDVHPLRSTPLRRRS
jgi:hypothetical protein